jgi:hypothetical protein
VVRSSEVRCSWWAMCRFGQRLPGGAYPLLPLAWGLRGVIGVEEKLPAHRTGAPLRLEQAQAETVQRWGCCSAAPIGPVLGQGRVPAR